MLTSTASEWDLILLQLCPLLYGYRPPGKANTLSSNSWAKKLTYLDIHDLLCRDWLGALEWNDAEHFVIHPGIRLPWMHLEVGPDFSVPFPQDSPRKRDSLQPPITPRKPCQSDSFVFDPSPPRKDCSISYHLVFWKNKNQYSNTPC